jgi:hypothetical protein
MDKPHAERATQNEDAFDLAERTSADELTRLKLSEELFELRYQRQRRRSRFQTLTQSLVGFVAVAGFFANAFQAYLNKQAQQKQQQMDQDRWSREFERAQRADKYRAFFETSALVTDENNPNKRLVGYALLKEFVSDPDYNDKATVLLTEALTQELRRDNLDHGLSEESRVAVARILDTLSHTPDCGALANAARSIEYITKRKAQFGNVEEAVEVFEVYVRRLLGQAALACSTFAEFQQVRRPLAQVLEKNPELSRQPTAPNRSRVNELLAQLLRNACVTEIATGAGADCPDIFEHYEHLCQEAMTTPLMAKATPEAEAPRAVIDAGHTATAAVATMTENTPPSSAENKRGTIEPVSQVVTEKKPLGSSKRHAEWSPAEEQAACALVAQPLPVAPPDAGSITSVDAGGNTVE